MAVVTHWHQQFISSPTKQIIGQLAKNTALAGVKAGKTTLSAACLVTQNLVDADAAARLIAPIGCELNCLAKIAVVQIDDLSMFLLLIKKGRQFLPSQREIERYVAVPPNGVLVDEGVPSFAGQSIAVRR